MGHFDCDAGRQYQIFLPQCLLQVANLLLPCQIHTGLDSGDLTTVPPTGPVPLPVQTGLEPKLIEVNGSECFHRLQGALEYALSVSF